MINYKGMSLTGSLSEVKIGRGSTVCERVCKKIVEYFKKHFVYKILLLTYKALNGLASTYLTLHKLQSGSNP